ncbi:MAG TPA: efflux RND transporter permease subunit [Vicinamibacterales bacterium]|nr:efflux RND transporter permease subunit [Vicinamibacterales bacterium]
MIIRLLEIVIRFRVVVWTLLAIGVVASVYAMTRAPLDAIPDISDPQVVVYVKWPRSPQLLESNVTEPLIKALAGAPEIQSLRGTSHMGYSFIYVILANGAQRGRVQQLVTERINAIRPQLPPDAVVTLGPNASSMGWIYQYALVDKEKLRDLRELRLLNESQIKPALQGIPGVAEVASVGGLEKQYQVKLFPPLLANTGVSLRQVINALQSVFQEVGGRTIEVTNREYQLRGVIASEDVDQLRYLMVARARDGAPIQLKDVGYVQVGYDLRRSTADLDGNGEVVGGIAIMEQDQNVLTVTRAIEQRLAAVRQGLPGGIEILTTYDRSTWIWATLKQFFATLISELVVLILVTVLFLGDFRSAAGPIAILLLSTLFTVLPLAGFDQTINLFSLAGLCIAIGAIEDATIVIVENCASDLAAHAGLDRRQKREVILHSIARVARPLLFSLLIIVASFLPVFFLEARERRLFDPLAYSKTFAVALSTLLTILLLPIIMVWVFERDVARTSWFKRNAGRGKLAHFTRHRYALAGALVAAVVLAGAGLMRVVGPEFRPELLELTGFVLAIVIVWALTRRSATTHRFQETRPVQLYAAALRLAIRYRYPFTAAGLMVVIVAVVMLRNFQRDFLPDVDEGSILYMPTTLPGLPTREAGWIVQQMDRKLKAIPEVDRVFAKLGRADTSTDPAPVSMIETTILLKPKSSWRPRVTKEKLVGEMDAAMQVVGYVNTWVQPIRARVMMQTTGIQTPVGLKVKGPEVAEIERISQEIEGLLRQVPGTKYVLAERISEGYYTDVRYDLARLASHGVTADEAMLTVRYGIGGDNVLGIKQPDSTIVPLAVQYSAEYLDTVEKVRNTPVMAGDGSVALSEVADVAIRKMPEMLRNDNGSLSGYIYVDIQNVTATDYVDRAQQYLSKNLVLPVGYSLEWTGLYEYTTAASRRLRIIVPLTLAIIFVLLVMAFHSITEAFLVAMSVPFAMAGGVFLQWALGYAMTTAVIIGYISVFAVAVQTGIIMVIFIREALVNKPDDQSFLDAVVQGSTARLRPKLMTVATIILSLSLIPLSSGPGMEIMKPIAAPSIGGMVTSTLHVLFMTPCLFVIAEDIRRYWSRRRGRQVSADVVAVPALKAAERGTR